MIKKASGAREFILQNFYEHIKGADILELLKRCLTHEDPNVRAKACSAIGNMCRYSSYFYGLLIGNAAYHNDFFYEDLRRCIPQLAKLLLSAEEDKTKANAYGALGNLGFVLLIQSTAVDAFSANSVIIWADTRATEGPIVADKNYEKIHYMAPYTYCCGVGTAISGYRSC